VSDFKTHLLGLLEDAALPLPGVRRKKMFGCEALFAEDRIFALIWKEDRIGLKFPDPAVAAEALALPGAAPWRAGDKVMGGWALVPEAFHDDPAALAAWVQRAHALALSAPPKPKKKTGAGK
jgi:TfoX/Sxy family transcriptional regulator of competence genes